MTDPGETFTSGAATEWRPSRFPGVSLKALRSDFVLEGDVRIGRHHTGLAFGLGGLGAAGLRRRAP
jgi:hypothetical protein